MFSLLRTLLPAAVRRPIRGALDSVRAQARWARIRWLARTSGRRRRRDGPIRLGLLAGYFPPEVTGGTYRSASLSQYAAEAGLEVIVVAGHIRQRLTDAGKLLAGRVPRQVTVHRARPPELRPFEARLVDLDGGFLNLLETYASAERAFQNRIPDAILATGPPFNGFVAAYHLAARYGCHLVLDYRDEWTEGPHPFVSRSRDDRKWEARCLQAADRVVFTTESGRRHSLEVFPVLKPERCFVIPNGWDPDDWDARRVEPRVADSTVQPLSVSFFGNLGEHSPPDVFLTTLERALRARPDLQSRIRFRFIGQKSVHAEERLNAFPIPGVIEALAHIPKRQAIREMCLSAGLLLLNPPRWSRLIPGKLYEYVAAGPPLLVFGLGGEVGEIVQRLAAGLVVAEGDADGLAAALDRILEGGPCAESEERKGWLAEHTRERLARRMIALLRESGDTGPDET